jgi:hypothetical protein
MLGKGLVNYRLPRTDPSKDLVAFRLLTLLNPGYGDDEFVALREAGSKFLPGFARE